MKIFGDNVLSLYICTQTIKGFYVYLLSSFYIGVRSFVKSTGFLFFISPFPPFDCQSVSRESRAH